MADEHSLDGQRIYNLACWALGAEPGRGQSAARFVGLPVERAERCGAEYARLEEGMRARFKKYISFR
ncbi:hypothetical protein FN976_11095 [Caenimonas sedimenti]|uniref:Uncharacterized protein n=1 Tax=Caenimonas sedimenti TaxID=2596921 RepID=A0A562ZTI7_9BURK|nr:hypothetical protein FN976_11095 [Caenimonas sedimenti]